MTLAEAIHQPLVLRIARFANRRARTPLPENATWQDFAKTLCAATPARSDKDGPLFSPAIYAEGSTRGNAGVQALTAVVLDFDGGETPAQVLARTAALRGNQATYKAFKTVEPLLNKAEVGVAGRMPGDVPAALLPQAVANSYRGGVAGAPLAELAQMGSRFLVDRVPQTGGSAKALLQNSMVVGGLLGTGGITSPLALIGAPAAIRLNKALGSAALSRGLLAPAAGPGAGLGLKAGLLAPAARFTPLLGADRDVREHSGR